MGSGLWYRARRRFTAAGLCMLGGWIVAGATGVAVFGLIFVTQREAWALILFGVRALAAGLFPLAHLRWLKAALDVLRQEGSLRS